MCHNLLDKKILTSDSDVIPGHHCGLSGSVIHQAEFSEIFAGLELIHLKYHTQPQHSHQPPPYLFLLPVYLLEDNQCSGLNKIHSIASVTLGVRKYQ